MTPAPGELEIARIGGAHGVRGEVSVTFVSNRPERTEPGSVLRAGDRTLEIASARAHHDKWLVRFEGIDDRAAAEELRGLVLTARPIARAHDDDRDEYWVHELIGSEVVDATGAMLGRVDSVEANPAHDLLVLDTGALIPLTFIVERGERDRLIIVDLPEGLLDL